MSRPQQPELARSAKTDLDPDHVETGLQGQRKPQVDGPTGPVPPENAPGHHPPKEQDKPDLDVFAAQARYRSQSTGGDERPQGSRAESGSGQDWTGQGRVEGRAGQSPPAARRPGPEQSPAAPPKVEATPAKRPAAAPPPGRIGRDLLERRRRSPHLSPSPRTEHEPRLVGLMLMPLRQTVKGLEQLDRTLSDRLTKKARWARGGLGPRGR